MHSSISFLLIMILSLVPPRSSSRGAPRANSSRACRWVKDSDEAGMGIDQGSKIRCLWSKFLHHGSMQHLKKTTRCRLIQQNAFVSESQNILKRWYYTHGTLLGSNPFFMNFSTTKHFRDLAVLHFTFSVDLESDNHQSSDESDIWAFS